MADKKQNSAAANDTQFYTKPPELGKWESFRIFLWNPDTSQFLGRTASSWAKILFFYICFYAVLIGFFATMLTVFYQTLDYKVPKWQLDRSLIGTNPGLGFRPMPPEINVESTLVWYKSANNENIKYWSEELDKFLVAYNKSNNPHADRLIDCAPYTPPPNDKVCDVKIDQSWYPCVPLERYSYNTTAAGPCIFLKLNRIYNWVPEYYNTTNLPADTKDYLKKAIQDETRKSSDTKMVWVTCEGENVADKEHIGPIRYIPQRGFPSQYFPYKNQEGYLSPLVAVHFEKPARNVLINIECKAWAKNIIHDRAERRGSVHFELLVD
ncbi:sodium/potassium-transporting ATPase subunit beta-2 [Cylas formicarius]|uniref:sodium/potassium-transporting ATPase subunit beta-2 n=1 Tax=Cylas formicarius TaxID=197179 RepID=UPI0029589D49|nr:sodium/potassium-transporting ATPase subunit beta-2 [Cylas formicarius]